jgi:alpha-tubulin suppressor-like RCC1 family protein
MGQKLWRKDGFLIFLSITTLFLALWQPSLAPANAAWSGPATQESLVAGQPQPVMPEAVETLSFTSVAAGAIHTCGLTAGGGVKCWGDNYWGQLGDGTTTGSSNPVDVIGLASGVTAIAAGFNHTCALTAAGGVKCWGENWSGQLGDNTTTDRSTPVDVVGLASGVTVISAGGRHTCALAAGGAAKCWGFNGTGQLGDDTTTQRTTPVNVLGLPGAATAIAAGWNHTCALAGSGGMKCWGANDYGQLGDGTMQAHHTPVNVGDLAAGVSGIAVNGSHTCARLSTGGLKCWGDNEYGQVGNDSTYDQPWPVDVVGLGSGVIAVTAGESHTCVLVAGGGMKCWGMNFTGQLGDGTTVDRHTPVNVIGLTNGTSAISAGHYHTCAVSVGGVAKCWGWNGLSQLGDGILTHRSVAVDAAETIIGSTAIASGGAHTCVLTAGGGMKCWGANVYGQLGDGTTIQRGAPVDVIGLASGVIAIATGESHTCALLAAGGVKCWGYNSSGQLGDGTLTNRLIPVDVSGLASGVTDISAGGAHTCALAAGGGAKCWGSNSNGQLGDNSTTPRSTPVDVLGLSSGVTGISANGNSTCALAAGGAAKCWGDNYYGQLGDGTTTQRNTPVEVASLSSGTLDIASGGVVTCALVTGGGVKCWGSNWFGELGDGTTTNSSTPVDVVGLETGVTAITADGAHACALKSGGVKCWGYNELNQLGDGTIINRSSPVSTAGMESNVIAIDAGGYHTCALVSSGRPKCWGEDVSGQLGVGTLTNRLTPADVVESRPYLTVNYPTGLPGSFFTITGWKFPPGAPATLVINGYVLTTALLVNPTGSFIVFLDTGSADAGRYRVDVSASGTPGVSTAFSLDIGAPLQIKEGGGLTFIVPPGIVFHNFTFLPTLRR